MARPAAAEAARGATLVDQRMRLSAPPERRRRAHRLPARAGFGTRGDGARQGASDAREGAAGPGLSDAQAPPRGSLSPLGGRLTLRVTPPSSSSEAGSTGDNTASSPTPASVPCSSLEFGVFSTPAHISSSTSP